MAEESRQPAASGGDANGAARAGTPRRRLGPVWFFVLKWAVLLLAIAAAAIALWLTVRGRLLPGGGQEETASIFPDSLAGLLPDDELGYNTLDFQDAVLGETREKHELVVMEQDVQIDTTITQTLANITLFSKTKGVRSFGRGIYTVDLSGLLGEDIAVDTDAHTVTVQIPRAVLQYIEIDVDRTEFEDTQRGLLAFTDITMTAEQQNLMSGMIEDAMRARLTEEKLLLQADESARTAVRALLQPLVSAVSDAYLVLVTMRG